MNTTLLPTSTPPLLAVAVEAAAQALTAGDPVALPTETVYGLAADALRPEAAVKIFEAKERPFFDPLIVHLPTREWLERVAAIPPESRALVEALIEKFWPGPLTLVLPRCSEGRAPARPWNGDAARPSTNPLLSLPPPRQERVPPVADIVTSGLETVAVRMSAHPVFRAVIERFGGPLAAPSANRFGRISPTTAEHVRSELGGRIPLIVDGGATEHGLESTIVRVEGETLTILRAGPVTAEALAEHGLPARGAGGHPARLSTEQAGSLCSAPQPAAPGMLPGHYAPRTPFILGGTRSRASHSLRARPVENVWDAQERVPPRIGLLAWQTTPPESFDVVEVLSPTGDLREAAATLFAKLRRLDEAGLDLILAEPVPEHGLGIAIMDRLRKAAAAHAD